jgi:hypothetical protein
MHDRWLKRQAIQIAAQLPDGRDDALEILKYASELITDFLEVEQSVRQNLHVVKQNGDRPTIE